MEAAIERLFYCGRPIVGGFFIGSPMIAGQLEIQLYADIARIKKDMDDARRVVGDTMGSISGMADIAKKALGMLGVAMSANAFAGMIRGSIESAAGMHDLSIQTGASAASLMAFRSVASTTDTTIEGIGAAMNKMAKGMAVANEESKGIGQAVKAIGLDFNELKAMAPDQQMLNVAKALDRFDEGAGKSAVAMSLFGKEGAKMLPFLKDLAAESDSVTAKLGEEQVKAKAIQAALADDFSDNLTKIKKASEGWKKDLAMGMLPALTDASEAFLKASSAANGLNSTIKKLSEDGSIERWTRSAIDGVTALGTAIVPAAKIWGAYYTAFVVAPAAFTAVRAAIGALQVQLALAKMEMASGATMASLFGTSLGGITVSAELASGALGKLRVVAGSLFAAFAGWEIGTYLRNKFVDVRVAALSFVRATLSGWEHIKYGAQVAWEGVEFAWDKSIGSMRESFASYLDSVAKGLSFVGASDASKNIQAYAASLHAASAGQQTFQERTAGMKAAHDAAIASIDKNIVELINYEYAADRAGKGAVRAADGAAKAKSALNFDANPADTEAIAKRNIELEKQAALLAELSGLSGSFAKDWNYLTAVYARGAISLDQLTKAQADLLAKQPAIKAANDAEAKALADQEKLMDDVQGKIERDIDSINQQTAAVERKVATFGMLPDAITAAQMAELEASKQSLALKQKGIEDIQRRIDALGKLKEAQSASQMQDAAAEGARRLAEEYQRSSEQIGQSLTDNIMRGGKSAAQYLSDLFRTLVLRPIISPIGNAIGATMTSMLGMTGTAQAATTAGGVSGIGSLAGIGSSMLNFGGSAIAGLGNLVGSSSLSAFGAGFAGNSAGMAMSASEAFASAGMAAEAGAASLGAAISAAMPWVAGITAALAIAKSLDHSGTYHMGGASSASASGVQTVRAESLNFQPTQVSQQTNQLTAQLASGVVSMLDSTALAFGKTAGYTAATAFADDSSKDGAWGALVISKLGDKLIDWQDSRTSRWAPKEFADGAEGQQQYLSAISASVRTALDGIGLPSWAKKMLDQLGDTAGLDELSKVVAQINATQSALKAMGQSLVGFSSLSEDAVSALINAAGGIDSLSSAASSYYDAFYSEEEKSAGATKQIADALSAVGLAVPVTMEAYRALVEQQMALGEQGAATTSVLLKNAKSFAALHPEIVKVTDDNQKQADILRERQSLQDELDSLTMTEVQLLEKRRSQIDESNRGIFDQITALKAQKSAAEAAAQAVAAANEATEKAAQGLAQSFRSAMDKARNEVKSLRDFSDSLKFGGLSSLSADERYIAAKAAFESARPGDTQAAQSFLQASKDRGADSYFYERDYAAVQAKLALAITSSESRLSRLPDIYKDMVGSLMTPQPSAQMSIVRATTSIQSQPASNATLEEKVQSMSDKLEKVLKTVADNTAKLADQFDFVTEGGNNMVVKP